MTNTSSAKKALRQNIVRYKRNRAIKRTVRTFIKKVEAAVNLGDKSVALATFKTAQPIMHKGVSKGVFKLKTISRKLSRLSSRIKKMEGNFIGPAPLSVSPNANLSE